MVNNLDTVLKKVSETNTDTDWWISDKVSKIKESTHAESKEELCFLSFSIAMLEKKKLKLQKLARKETREKKKDPLNFMHIQITFFNLKPSIGFGREWALRVSFKQSLFFFWSKNHQHQHLHCGVAEQRRSYKMHTHTDTDKRQERQNLSMTNTDGDRLRQTWEQVKCEKKNTKHAVTCRWDSSIE